MKVLNDILDFSKIEAGKLELELYRLRPQRFVEGQCSSLGNRPRRRVSSSSANTGERSDSPATETQVDCSRFFRTSSQRLKFTDRGK